MRRHTILITIISTAVLGGLLLAPPANAAAAVTIKKISDKKVAYGKKATIKPSVRAARTTRVVSKRLTVKRGTKTIARNRSSVRLKSGKYTVVTTVKFHIRKDRTVTERVRRNVRTVEAGTDAPATCTASNLQPTSTHVYFDAVCTGANFDGSHQFSGVSYDLMNGAVWGANTSWSYVFADGVPAPSEGARIAVTLSPGFDLYQVRTVTTRKKVTSWSGLKTKKRSQSLTIKQRPRPSRTDPDAWGECPSWAPIKGNADSMIYHVPGGRWYDATIAEECFTTESAARAAGYRPSRNG